MKQAKSQLTIWKECLCAQTADAVAFCKKLTRLEREWQTLFVRTNETLGKKTAPGSCIIEKDGITLTVYAKNKSDITGLKFKETVFRSVAEKFLGAAVKKIKFQEGKTTRQTIAKEASRAFERYAKIDIPKSLIAEQKKFFDAFVENDNLAEILATTKLIAEKKAKRESKSQRH